MGFDPKPIRYTGLKCVDCFGTFECVSSVGAINRCDPCMADRLSELFSDVPGACGYIVLPVSGQAVTCGLRADLPKKQRRHEWVSLGMDTRNLGDRGFWDVEVFACMICGRDDKGSSRDANAISRME
jgi:hypothetical protein